MALPDISRLRDVPGDTARALAARLDALGLNAGPGKAVFAATQRVAAPLRRPIRNWHLRRTREPWAAAMRMLTFQDPVTDDEATAALGQLVGPLLDAGLLVRHDGGGVVSPFVLHVLEGLYLLADDLSQRGDAVMAIGGTTVALAAAACPPERAEPAVETCLDLGCGSGAVALRLAKRARKVVGTDINPRAVALARVNAALNGVENVDFRVGSLFEPVRGERFNLIASQPPFVPAPEGAVESTFLHGGPRGDELALELLSGVAPHLAERGRAVLMIEWPDHGEASIEQRIRGAIGASELDVLVIKAPPTSPDEHAANYTAAIHPALGPAFEREVAERREHLERVGVRGMIMSLAVLQRTDAPPGFTEAIEASSAQALHVTSPRIDTLMAARALGRRRDDLLAARLRMHPDATLTQRQDGPEGAPVVAVRYPEGALAEAIDLNGDLFDVVSAIHEAPDVRAGLSRIAEAYGMTLESAIHQALPAVEHALRHGLLEPG